jgi:hypothetical protein
MHLDHHSLHTRKVWVGGQLQHVKVARDRHSGKHFIVHHKKTNGTMHLVPMHSTPHDHQGHTSQSTAVGANSGSRKNDQMALLQRYMANL